MPYLIPLAPCRATTTFAPVPCTDASHLSPSDKGAGGHRRCKYPKKAVLVDSITGEFAIVHAKGEGYAPECKMMPPTPVMRDFSANVGVKVGHTMSKTVADSPTESSHLMEDDEWDLVGRQEAEEGYILRLKK